jgi:tricorn protease
MRSAILSAVFLLSSAAFAAGPPLMLQRPALNQTHIVFNFAGDLWIVPRGGGDAIRLTASPGVETDPVFSPDGRLVAFAGTYEGNMDIYTVPVTGGVPKRLTYHPSADVPLAFTPDGKKILFRSQRKHPRSPEFLLMGLDPGPAEEVPLPYGFQAVFSPDGARVAYTPLAPAFTVWKRYRGGRTSKIWLASHSDSKVEEIPRDNSNDFYPMWAGDKVYFLSDRTGAMNLHVFDLKTRRVAEAARSSGFEYKSASLGPGAIALERFGQIELFDLKSGKTAPVNIRLSGDLAGVRPYYDRVAQRISSAALSPTGVRAVFEARGDILTVPAEKGDVRNLTATPGVAERYPDWSPDGTKIAYFSDESGEYQLHIQNQNGMSPPEKIEIGWKAFFYRPKWSPDGKKILFRDSNLNLAWIDVASKKVTRFDTDYYDTPDRDDINPSWSPDSKWIVYTRILPNRLRAVHVYSLDSGKVSQVSDGLSDARYAAFDKDGRHLYFTASTNTALSTGWLDMSSIDRLISRSVYLVVLRKEDPSPLAPESDEEKAQPGKKEEAKPGEKKEEPKDKDVRIDLDGINQRILALPIPARNYTDLEAGKAGIFFLMEMPVGGSALTAGPPASTIHKFEMKTRKFDKVLDGVRSFTLSHNGEKMLLAQQQRWIVTAAGSPPKPNEGVLKTEQMEVRVDPVAEWRQMYREVWRIERDFLYDPGAHGLNLAEAEKRYEPFLAGVAHRGDLNYLFGEMLGNLVLGHTNVFGGSTADTPRNVPTGLLGADYKIDSGRYRFARVFDGENWNPDLRAPLTQPGVNVKAGEYLLAVNGRDVRSTDDLYSFFVGLADKQVVLKVGPNAGGEGARDVTVVPIASEINLRYMAWVEDNRRKVEQLSGGRLGYVHLPNTSIQGYTHFNRWYFGQVGKEGFVLDERFNGGGFIADYIIDYLRRPLLNFFTTRAGHDFTTPMNAVFGPKVMIVNEYAGSGGDAMPWMFKKLKIGTLVGKRTWGGLVGIFGFPQLIDGGAVTAPNLAFYNTEKQWDVENHGVTPDVEVDYDPAMVRQGRDPQLEKAVEILLDSLKKNPLPKHEKPAYPDYYRQ